MQSNCLVRNKGFKGKSLDTLNNSEALLEHRTYNGASTIPREFTERHNDPTTSSGSSTLFIKP